MSVRRSLQENLIEMQMEDELLVTCTREISIGEEDKPETVLEDEQRNGQKMKSPIGLSLVASLSESERQTVLKMQSVNGTKRINVLY